MKKCFYCKWSHRRWSDGKSWRRGCSERLPKFRQSKLQLNKFHAIRGAPSSRLGKLTTFDDTVYRKSRTRGWIYRPCRWSAIFVGISPSQRLIFCGLHPSGWCTSFTNIILVLTYLCINFFCMSIASDVASEIAEHSKLRGCFQNLFPTSQSSFTRTWHAFSW